MPDKFRDLSPVNVSFSSGEQPTATKLNGWADQISRGLQKVEEAMGDLYSDNHPLFASSNTPIGGWGYQDDGTNIGTEQRHAQVLSLARLVGPASVLNPRVLSGGSVTLTEDIPDGQNTFKTRYRPISSVSFSNSTIFNGAEEATAGDVSEVGDYFVDETNGLITFVNSGTAGTITYTVTDMSAANATDTYENATFNVIPDPNQELVKCTVAGPSGGKYTVTLPTATHGATDWNNLTTALDSDEDPNYGVQLTLPSWTSEYSGGETLPDGLVKIWDGTAKTFLEGQTFYYVGASSVQVDDSLVLVAGSDRYSIVVAGTDITRTLDNLRTRFHKHEHTGADGSKPIDHSQLTGAAQGTLTIDQIGIGGTDKIVGFTEDSTATNYNDHPQYLHRAGMDTSDLKNAMLGDILFAPSEHNGTDIFFDGSLGESGTSTYGIVFGDDDTQNAYIKGGYGNLGGVGINVVAGSYVIVDADKYIQLNATTDVIAEGTARAKLSYNSDTAYIDMKAGSDQLKLFSTQKITLDTTGQNTYAIDIKSGKNIKLTPGDGTGGNGSGDVQIGQHPDGFVTAVAFLADAGSAGSPGGLSTDPYPITAPAHLSGKEVYNVSVMLNKDSDDEWLAPSQEGVSSRSYRIQYDATNNEVDILDFGTYWNSGVTTAIRWRIVFTYEP